jgi:HEAT repeat protein
MVAYLQNNESAVRYWGATGLLILGDKAVPALEYLKNAITDRSASVVVVAAEALYKMGETEIAKNALINVLNHPNEFARCQALNAIDCMEDASPEIVEATVSMIKRLPEMNRNRYDLRAARWLVEKWGLNTDDFDLVFNW